MTAGHNKKNKKILADGRWKGLHGIGRFSHEILSRLKNTDIITHGPPPLSWKNFFWLPFFLFKNKSFHKIYFTPGFNPVLFSSPPVVFTIHDLTHIYLPGKKRLLKKIYYEVFLKLAAKRAKHIITVSEYSKKKIMDWSAISAEKITVVGNGISEVFTLGGKHFDPGFSYFLHVGNAKAHKNVERLVGAFGLANIDTKYHLILTCQKNSILEKLISSHHLQDRIHFHEKLTDETLAEYYRGAVALIFPSLYEGFGIPLLEAMACGTPVITSNVTSLPEVAGDAALLIEPRNIKSISSAIEQMVNDDNLRNDLIQKGFARVKDFSWEKTAKKIQTILDKELDYFGLNASQ